MDKKYPIAFVSPHAGLAVPPELDGRIALTPAQIFNESDAYVDEIYDFADRALYYASFPFARAIIDVNRPIDPKMYHRPGDGAVKEITSYGAPVFLPGREPDAALQQQLIETYWQPWHDQLGQIAADPRVKLVIDAHSMAAVGPTLYDDPSARRPCVEVANQGDLFGHIRAEWGRISAPPELTLFLAQELGVLMADVPGCVAMGPQTAVNTPFRGGYNLTAHGGRQQPWVMIELNRALYLGDQDGDTPIRPLDPERRTLLRNKLWQGLLALMQFMEIIE